MTASTTPDLHGGRLRVPRSRGASSGIAVIVLGLWGALVPFVGPYAHFGYTPASTWDLTAGRFWYELLPGVVAVLAGLLMLTATSRILGLFGGWIAAVAGAWLLVGPTLSPLLDLGSMGSPIDRGGDVRTALETLLLFDGIGALIVFFGALAVGRLTVVGVRDVRAAQTREAQTREAREAHETQARAAGTRHDETSAAQAHGDIADRPTERFADPARATAAEEPAGQSRSRT